MKKTFGLLLVLVLALVLAIPVQASNSGDRGLMVEGDSIKYCVEGEDRPVENEPPTILWSSLLVRIINDEGTAWEWHGGNKSGYRAVPYVFEGERLHFELDVYDANGIVDIEGMEVKVTLAPDLELLCGLDLMELFPNVPLSYGHYSGDLVIDASIAQGKYDITVTATDQGAGHICPIHPPGIAYYDPAIYQGTSDILMKPALTLEVDGSEVAFPVASPGSERVEAHENPMGLRPQAVIGTEHIPVLFSLYQSGTDMVGASGVIPVDDIGWSLSNQPFATVALSYDQQMIAIDVEEGETFNIYYWLNIPSGQADGTYHGQIDYDFIAY